MSQPVRFRRAVGTPDGVETDFETEAAYQPGTLRVLVNGLFRRPELDNGFDELGGADFRMKIPPLAGDTLWTFYREA